MQKIKKIVLAYSGGLDTSVILKWLKDTYKCEVIAFTADLGQADELSGLKEKALKTGAAKFVIKDLREEFVKDFIFPMLRANACYEGQYLLGTSIARPLIAKEQIRVAIAEGADAVAHGATGKGNDQVRFELTYYALKPSIKVVAPWRDWDLNSREGLIAYAKKNNIPVPVTKAKPYSSDRNLFHISFEGGILEDPDKEPPADMFILTKSVEKAPNKATYIELNYVNGDPAAINGEKLSPAALLTKLNLIAGENGIGRLDLVENRFVGIKSRGVYETPGGTILHIAHKAIESLTLDREVVQIRDTLIPKYAQLIYNGFWFSPEREMLQTAIDHIQENVTGTVRLKLYKGNCIVAGRKAKNSLYDQTLATFEKEEVYNPQDAKGFIALQALRLKTQTKKKQK